LGELLFSWVVLCFVFTSCFLGLHRGTAGIPARYNAESFDFFSETADYVDVTDKDCRGSRVGCLTLTQAARLPLHHYLGAREATIFSKAGLVRSRRSLVWESQLGCSSCLESLLHLDVPKPAFDRGERLIVAVLKAAGPRTAHLHQACSVSQREMVVFSFPRTPAGKSMLM
jgi:hypothetical protein